MSQALRRVAVPLTMACTWAAAPMAVLAEPAWTPAAQREAQASSYARDMESRLNELPGVHSATARVQLPSPLDAPLDAPAPRPRAHVSITRAHGAPSGHELARLAALSVPGLRVDDLRVDAQVPPPPGPPRWVRVGPFEASPRSAPWLRACLIALLLTTGLLGGLLLHYAKSRLADRRTISPPRR